MQYILCGAAYGKGQETSAGPKLISQIVNWGTTQGSHNPLQQLHWLSIHFQAEFKVLVLTYKALNGLGPSYLKDLNSLYEPARVLRSSGEAFLSVPPPSQVHLVGTRERAFSVAAPRLWNSLPQETRLAPS